MSGWQEYFGAARREYAAGRPDAAAAHAEEIARLFGGDGAALAAAAGVMVSVKRYPRGLELAELAVSLRPDLVEAQHAKAAALLGMGRRDEGVAILRPIVEAQPTSWGPRFDLAKAMMESGRAAEAAEVCRPALAAMPGQPAFAAVFNNAVAGTLGDADMVVPVLRDAAKASPDDLETLSGLACSANAGSKLSAGEILACHRAYGDAVARRRQGADAQTDRDPERRLRLGIVSFDYRRYSSVGSFLIPLLETIDQGQFDVTAYHTDRATDEMTEVIKTKVGRWRHMPYAAESALAAQVREDGIDIAMELVGHTSHRTLAAFQPRCAPVQVAYLGYSNTWGMRSFDWRIVDSLTDPAPAADALSVERLWRLDPCFLCFRPDAEIPPPSPAPCLWTRTMTFGSFSNLYKLNDRVLGLWGRVLAGVPGSRLLLKNRAAGNPETLRHLVSRMAAAGMDLSRVEVRPMTASYVDHLKAYGEVDVSLDTFPYNGTTTVCESLLMGVPMLGLAPPPEFDRHAARVTLSLLTNAGLPELIAPSEDAFVERARDLCRDREGLSDYREHIRRAFRNSPICDAPAFGARFGRALREMWRVYCRGAT